MKCENCWCEHWNYNKCSIAEDIVINSKGKCVSCEGENVRVKTVLERQEWQDRQYYGKLYDELFKKNK